MKQISVMRSTLGRLPAYLEYLQSLDPNTHPNISATSISKALGLGDVQVRKDLGAVSGAGRPKTGYDTASLIKRLSEVLGQYSTCKAVIVGAGRLGNALLGYGGFSNYGLEISAAFDSSDAKIGSSVSGKPILSTDELGSYCKAEGIKIGIITVPAEAAQDACDLLIKSGITAIWNFAPCSLETPEGIILRQENLALSLAHLKLQLDNQNN